MLAIDVTKLNTLIDTEITGYPGQAAAYNASRTKTLVDNAKSAPFPTAVLIGAGIDALPVAEKATYSRLIKFLREFCPGVDEEIAGRVTYRGFGFRANSASLLSRAKEAWALMGKLTATVSRYTQYVRDPGLVALGGGIARKPQSSEEQTAIDLYKEWFDVKLKYARIAEVRRIFTNLHNATTAQDFEIICEGDPADPKGLIYPDPIAPGEFGEVRGTDNRNRFYLGPVFFDALAQNMGGSCSLSVRPSGGQTYAETKAAIFTALNASTITMLHELTHIRAIGDTDDVGGWPTAYKVGQCKDKAINAPDDAIKNAENYALFAKALLQKIQFSPPSLKR